MDKKKIPSKHSFANSRREFLKNSVNVASAGSLLSMTDIAYAKSNKGKDVMLEKTHIDLGFIPLNDCASLVIAKDKGFFDKHGLNVSLKKQSSWSGIRDNVMLGALDGAHMLASMPIATTLGIGTVKKATITPFTMALNGNGITVSHELYARMLEADPQAMQERPITARALKKVIEEDKVKGRPLMTFATVFPVSTHNYELRYWMAAAGIDPDNDIRLTVIPPSYIVENLEARTIVGCCVGEPWNAVAVNEGVGRTLITKYELWNNSPEKVFGVNLAWAEKHPNTLNAIVKALIEASMWIDVAENRLEAAAILAQEQYVNAPLEVMKMSMTGTFQYARHLTPQPMPDFNVFHRYSANFPWISHAQWFISQMLRWGQIDQALSINALASQVFRPDIYAQAAAELGVSYPETTVKEEGLHEQTWRFAQSPTNITMGPDKFFDHHVFNPARAADYVYDFEINHARISKEDLKTMNS